MVIITFIRHGETDFNKHGILQGHLNTPLNDNGRRQAVLAGQRLNSEHTPIDLVISSDLDRAVETASLIVDQLSEASPSRPIITTPLLRERYLGKLEGVDLRQFVNWEELTEAKKMIELQNILSHKFNLNSLITLSTSSTPPVKLTSEFLKHLPQKELKLESKRKLIKRAKEAFQFILRQIPHKYLSQSSNEYTHHLHHHLNNNNNITGSISYQIPSPSQLSPYISSSPSSLSSFSDLEDLKSTHSLTSSNSSSSSHSSASSTSSISSISSIEAVQQHLDENTSSSLTGKPEITSIVSTDGIKSLSATNNPNREFHILVVSHSLTLKVILSLLLCKRQQAKQLLFCQKPNNLDATQSEQSSHQNFKWVQFELKNASIVRTNFSIIEKKSSDHTKLLPRDIFFSLVTTVETTASG